MPFHLPALPVLANVAPETVQRTNQSHSLIVEKTLVLTAQNISQNGDRDYVEATGTVVARFGPTTVYADRVQAWRTEERAIVSGHVVVEDPEGRITASAMEFSWKTQSGTAEGVQADIDGVELQASQAHIEPGRWELIDVATTTTGSSKQRYLIRTPRLVIRPGKDVVATSPTLEAGGRSLLALPTQSASLDQRVQGLRPPSFGLKNGKHPELTWQEAELFQGRNVLNGSFASIAGSHPTYTLNAYSSVAKTSDSAGRIGVASDLDERFSYGWFENLAVRTPEDEASFLRQSRETVGVGSDWNVSSFTRGGEERFNKPIEAAYQQGGALGTFGYLGQARFQSIGLVGGTRYTRGVLRASLAPPSLKLATGLSALLRFDAGGFVAQGQQFGWAHTQLGLVYQPKPAVTIGAAYVLGGQRGTPLFGADELDATHALHARIDWTVGPRSFGILGKYDLGLKRWYDREYSLTQTVGLWNWFDLSGSFPKA